MMEEVEGIVLWCIEGLERLIRNDYQFTISNKSQLLMNEMQEDDDNILSFLESTGYIGLEKALMPPLKIYMLLIADGAMITWMYL